MYKEEHLVSVVIPTYNYEDFISDAIKSVICQTYKNIEIFVIDDGSRDNTREVVQKQINQDSRIRYIYQENKGLSAARNVGIKSSNGIFIAFLDSDDMWFPKKLELQMDVIQKSPSVGLVGCGIIQIDHKGDLIQIAIPEKKMNIKSELNVRNAVCGSASGAFIKKECFEKVGLFDEKLKAAEDWDMWLRISKYYDIKFVEEPLVKIRIHDHNMTKKIERMKNAQAKVIRKNIKGIINKIKVYSYIYLDAAREYYKAGNRKLALANILKSISICPFHVYDEDDKYSILTKAIIPSSFHPFFKKISNIRK